VKYLLLNDKVEITTNEKSYENKRKKHKKIHFFYNYDKYLCTAAVVRELSEKLIKISSDNI